MKRLGSVFQMPEMERRVTCLWLQDPLRSLSKGESGDERQKDLGGRFPGNVRCFIASNMVRKDAARYCL